MRKIIVFTIMSLDGYYAGPDDNVMALPFDESFDTYCVERLRAASTLLLGATSYSMFRSFWPAVVDNPDATPDQREISRRDNELEKVVVSDRLTEADTAPWTRTTRIVPRKEAHAEIAVLKDQPGEDILVFGSRTMWIDLLEHGLVDEVHLMVGAGIVGAGTPTFERPTTAPLRLIDTYRRDPQSNVVLRYATT